MRTFQQQRNDERFEQLTSQLRQFGVSSLKWLGEVLSDLWELPSKEPRVRQKIDRSGNVYWQAYDPIHDLTTRFDDEQTVLEWLDRQLYRQARGNLWNID